MSRILSILMLTFSAVILVSCNAEHSAAEDAILARIIEEVPQLDASTLYLTHMEVMSTVTLGEELSYRERVLTMKLNAENDFADKYRAAGKKRNAARHDSASVRTSEILRWVQNCRDDNRDALSGILYYVAAFGAEGRSKAGNGRFFTEKLAVLLPDGSVWAIYDRGANVRAGTGMLIPGYEDALKFEENNLNN